ncbi:hypothetical protein [Campylobacter sp. RM12651]|uniref:hypothetical protein n=1 Tax=Campylobacter sp. RM12651 TaxID=1660079 RepID=UPI001EFA6280|nr:hypothetical protein [Campylobacter sp. RM12651]ULO04488.1 hypothetical protein AVBRAN_a0006 [Campylobacter sp. RM12651]
MKRIPLLFFICLELFAFPAQFVKKDLPKINNKESQQQYLAISSLSQKLFTIKTLFLDRDKELRRVLRETSINQTNLSNKEVWLWQKIINLESLNIDLELLNQSKEGITTKELE